MDSSTQSVDVAQVEQVRGQTVVAVVLCDLKM